MRILVTGGNGQLGNELQRILREGRSEIGPIPDAYAGAEIVAADVDELDVTDADAVMAYVTQGGFDLIEPEPRVEDDPTGPVSAYGRTKLAGEERSLAACSRCFVVRTAWLYGYVGKNFVKTMMRLGADRDEVTVVDDQLGNPTSANDLAHEILKIAATENYGVYHCTNEGTCSWADFAEAVMEGAGLDCAVIRCTSEEYAAMNPASAKRPAYSSLRNKRLEDTVGNEMRPWRDALSAYLNNLPEMEG